MAKTLNIASYKAQTACESVGKLTVSTTLPAALKDGLLAVPARSWHSYLSRRRHRRAMRELQQLDDRMLRDIGIDRSEIPRVARYGREVF